MAVAEVALPALSDERIFPDELAADVFAQVLGAQSGINQSQLAEQGIVVSQQLPTKQVAGYLKLVADKLDQDATLNNLISQLKVDETTVYDTFRAVASEIFRGGITWGRVAVLFMFGAKLAMRTFYDTGKLFKTLVDWVARFVTERLMTWIEASGGWSALGTFVMEKFADAITAGDETDGPSGMALSRSNVKWLVIGIGLGVAAAVWAYSQK